MAGGKQYNQYVSLHVVISQSYAAVAARKFLKGLIDSR